MSPISGMVSVILVNFRGTDDTIQAIQRLAEIDWPRESLEIIVVENGSGDDSAERLRAEAPDVTLIVSSTNTGFAGGCNLGVAQSSGEFVALLNNDAKPDRAWIRAAIARFDESPRIGAVASKVLDWSGERVDYIGSALTWYGMGFKPFEGERVPEKYDHSRDVLFGTGSAMFVRRSVYDALGGFDERFFMFFEDVDFGWRLNLAGWRFSYQPESIAYHKHHGSMKSFGSHKETYLLERNALYTLYKNMGDGSLPMVLPGAIALAVRRAISRGTLDSTAFDLRTPGGDAETTMNVSRATMAGVFAIDQFVQSLPTLRASRDSIQRDRRIPEGRVWELFGMADSPIQNEASYVDGYQNIVESLGIADSVPRSRVLIITGDPLGVKLAGPAIRAWNMADVLSRTTDVTLLSLSGAEPIDAPFTIAHVRPGDDRAFRRFERAADIIIFQGLAMASFRDLQTTDRIVVVDIYDPMHLEQLEQSRELPAAEWTKQVEDATAVLNQQMLAADFLFCASERQRMFWLGQLAALGRINPATYEGDPDLEGLIGVVPFGLSSTPPVHTRPVVKGVVPGIGSSDKLLLWSGGLYNWFDPQTLIRAVADVATRRPGVRLFFQGTKHPHPGVPEMAIVEQSRALAKELGALDTSVFFNPSWVDYADRQNYLTEADAGVSTHHSHIETTFSFRTRILDYLWAELPMVVTAGDHFAELVEREELGLVVEAGDVKALSAALERVLFDTKFANRARLNIKRVRERYFWETALQPLVDFVADPHHAGDRPGGQSTASRTNLGRKPVRRSGLRYDIGRAGYYLKTGGIGAVVQKVSRRIRWSVR